ncbi:hypothetical protein BMS3Bbin10_02378 [bacterium BMS3Bbin10]|nr:hypothetical protein BMS3Bbin10_02378 [bacterium BMS3Bbin10]
MDFGPESRLEAEAFALEDLRADLQYEILKALKARGLSQRDLASQLGCSAGWVSQFLGDNANLTLESISKVFLALGLRCVPNVVSSEYFGHVEHVVNDWETNESFFDDISTTDAGGMLLALIPDQTFSAGLAIEANDNFYDAAEMKAA